MTTELAIFGGKAIVILLIATLLSVNIGVIAIINNNNENQEQDRLNLAAQADFTRKTVNQHANDTSETLNIVQQQQAFLHQEQKEQEPILEKFNMHINQTAVGVPKVLENNKLLQQILSNITANQTTPQ
jgi:glutamate synthase domain-containing protein 1